MAEAGWAENIILGTAQFGMKYGVTNRTKLQPEEINNILAECLDNNIVSLDTAQAYGDAEQRIGESGYSKRFKIYSKISPIEDEIITKNLIKELKDSILASIDKLKVESIHALMVHNESDFLKQGSELLYDLLNELKIEGLIKNIGVSTYLSSKTIDLCESYIIDSVQIPYNILDRRIESVEYQQLYEDTNIEICARSVFLQGLLLSDDHTLLGKFPEISGKITQLKNEAEKYDVSLINYLLSFVFLSPYINKAVIGVNSNKQLQEIISCVNTNAVEVSFPTIMIEDTRFIDPREWKNLLLQ